MTANEPDLKTLIRKLEKRHQKKQATTALLAGTAVLGLIVLISPLFTKQESQPIVEVPGPVAPLTGPDAYANTKIEAKAAIVYDLTTQEVLYAKNSRSQLPLASLTKLLTMYAASDSLKPDATVVMTASALASEGESGFTEGETFAFKDLARIALVASSNDATSAIAETAAIAKATSGQNMLASAVSAMGLSQTYAINGTGLDESTSVSGGYGSAYDVATLSGALLTKAPDIAHATIASSLTIRSKEGVLHTLKNTNPDVVRVPNLLLSKTGFTDLAGGNLAVVFDAGIGHPVAIVVLGSSIDGRFRDVDKLLSLTLDHFAGIDPSSQTAAVGNAL
ncbi:MAG: D-alanyl-D-alanine carboxypeptidase (penicillin-binding protein 5/6) [Parcubacteria bacterium C7867-004]|nr:MAG: D-alanyl-D-alanine carboxypeptidase (penicillin-binding protein 5/6) [Parcubacteria bacterium C7867-004]